MIEIVTDPFPERDLLETFWERAWGGLPTGNYAEVIDRSLAHIAAMDGERMVGFVNVAWDGGVHAFILDTAVDPDFRRQGIATRLVETATGLARARGAHWLHVDFEPHLDSFYRQCGFGPTAAGLIRLR